MGQPVRSHRGRLPQGVKVCNASHLCKSHTRGQTGNQTHLRVPCVQNQNKGPQPRLDLQVEEQREGGQMGPGRRGPPAGGVTTALAEGLLFLPLEHRRDVLVPARLFILLRGIKQSPAYVPFK